MNGHAFFVHFVCEDRKWIREHLARPPGDYETEAGDLLPLKDKEFWLLLGDSFMAMNPLRFYIGPESGTGVPRRIHYKIPAQSMPALLRRFLDDYHAQGFPEKSLDEILELIEPRDLLTRWELQPPGQKRRGRPPKCLAAT